MIKTDDKVKKNVHNASSEIEAVRASQNFCTSKYRPNLNLSLIEQISSESKHIEIK